MIDKSIVSYCSLFSRQIVVLRPDNDVANSANRAIGPGEIETSLPFYNAKFSIRIFVN